MEGVVEMLGNEMNVLQTALFLLQSGFPVITSSSLHHRIASRLRGLHDPKCSSHQEFREQDSHIPHVLLYGLFYELLKHDGQNLTPKRHERPKAVFLEF